ncbi:hypothetical protein [Streptomyces atratus]|uniref:hypothetical protein n=1 Tax=Streptomyces atratus TaxID=1893 RepID=UPI00364A530F
MSDELLDLAIATAGGQEHWDTLRGLNVDISIGGPIWATKGWPPDKTFDQILTLDTVKEHIVFTPFTRPDQRMVFDAAADSVTILARGGIPRRRVDRQWWQGSQRRCGREVSPMLGVTE